MDFYWEMETLSSERQGTETKYWKFGWERNFLQNSRHIFSGLVKLERSKHYEQLEQAHQDIAAEMQKLPRKLLHFRVNCKKIMRSYTASGEIAIFQVWFVFKATRQMENASALNHRFHSQLWLFTYFCE